MRQYNGPVTVIGIGSLDEASRISQFVERHDLGFDNIEDPDGSLRQRLGVRGQPNWVFVDGETGKVERVVGAIPERTLLEKLEALDA